MSFRHHVSQHPRLPFFKQISCSYNPVTYCCRWRTRNLHLAFHTSVAFSCKAPPLTIRLDQARLNDLFLPSCQHTSSTRTTRPFSSRSFNLLPRLLSNFYHFYTSCPTTLMSTDLPTFNPSYQPGTCLSILTTLSVTSHQPILKLSEFTVDNIQIKQLEKRNDP